MEQASNDRRAVNKKTVFPLTDNGGHQVALERRSGDDRRKVCRNVASDILTLLH